jgi:hypothetical protein
MLRRTAMVIAGVLLVSLLACNRSGTEQNSTQGQEPAAQQAPAQASPAEQAQTAVQPATSPASPAIEKAPPARPVSKPAAAPPSQPAQTATAAAEDKPPVSVPVEPTKIAETTKAAEPVPVPTPPPPKTGWIPSGTRFEVRLIAPVSSVDNKSGDTFKATLETNLEADGRVLVPRGSIVTGKISDVKQPGRVEGRAALSMTVTEISVGDVSYPVETNTLAFEAEASTKEDAKKIGIGAGIGAIIGAIAGGGKGAAIGAAVGGGAGTATVLATKGKDVQFPAEERFSFVLGKDLGIKY